MAKKFEGSPADKRMDKAAAKKMGMPVKKFEKTAADKRMDKAGQKRMGGRGR